MTRHGRAKRWQPCRPPRRAAGWQGSRLTDEFARERVIVASTPSFDIVSKVDRQEVDNALNQTSKELAQRFDFRGVNASVAWAGEEGIALQADTEERVKAALDVLKEKLVKR